MFMQQFRRRENEPSELLHVYSRKAFIQGAFLLVLQVNNVLQNKRCFDVGEPPWELTIHDRI